MNIDHVWSWMRQWFPTWHKLRGWGNNRAIKSSYVWFFVVPLVARFCEKLPPTLEVPLFGATIELTLQLPFRWTVLFWMSVCFAAGQLLYAIFCPREIKLFSSFSDYRSRHAGNVILLTWVAKIQPEAGLLPKVSDQEWSEIVASDIFDLCRASYSTRTPWAAFATWILFVLGAILALVLALDSIRSVLEMS